MTVVESRKQEILHRQEMTANEKAKPESKEQEKDDKPMGALDAGDIQLLKSYVC